MTDPMATMVVMKEKLETKVFLPEPVYRKIPMVLFIMGAMLLAFAVYFYFGEFYSWASLYFGSGLVSCMFGVGLFMHRKRARRSSQNSS